MDANIARGLVNQILVDIDGAGDLHGSGPVTMCADAMFEGTLFSHPASEYLDAIDTVLAAGQLPTPAEQLSRRFTADDLLGFLRALGAELRSRLAGEQRGS